MDITHLSRLLWGHSLHEYSLMFDLESRLLKKPILELGFGPSSLNAELTQQGAQIISCYEIYQYSEPKILELAAIGFQELTQQLKQNATHLVWKNYKNIEELIKAREQAHKIWQADLSAGLKSARYRQAALPHLPFADHEFGLVLCPNIHFGHKTSNDLQAHLIAIKELCRVADEVRIFPLLNEENKVSPLLAPIVASLHIEGYGVEVRQVDYELQKGGNAMLRVWAAQCAVPDMQQKVKSAHVE